ncbi:MAG: LysR family transcriptional regulator [Sphingomonadales bacterium]|nr:LysR family transcriptional regulator [Sphingomonadales bacterium]
MHWDDLRIFLAAARSRTVSDAARKLGIDATTVSRRLDRLSGDLKSSLFESNSSGLVLSSHGQKLLVQAETVEHAIGVATGTLTGERSRLKGLVRISMSEGLATWIVARNMPSFRELHPEISLELVTTNGFLNPSKREADLAITLARPARGHLIASKLSDYRLGLFASKDYAQRNGMPLSGEELSQHPIIGYAPDFIYSDELRYLAEIGNKLETSLSSSSINVQHAMLHASCGVGVLPLFIGLRDPDLVRILEFSAEITRSFWMVVHQDSRRIARVSAVVDWLKDIVPREVAIH